MLRRLLHMNISISFIHNNKKQYIYIHIIHMVGKKTLVLHLDYILNATQDILQFFFRKFQFLYWDDVGMPRFSPRGLESPLYCRSLLMLINIICFCNNDFGFLCDCVNRNRPFRCILALDFCGYTFLTGNRFGFVFFSCVFHCFDHDLCSV